MYYNGEGVPHDYAEAVKWYRLAAAQGDAVAQYNLGVMYDNGKGVPQDHAKAMKWYRLTHHVHILEMNGDSYRLKQSKRRQRGAPVTNLPDSPRQA